jgi:predicted porin
MRQPPIHCVCTTRNVLTSLALCAAANAACAQSGVTIYGLIDTTIRYTSHTRTTTTPRFAVGEGLYTGSRFGLRGSEDLGGGLKAIFTMEMGFDASTGNQLQATSAAGYGQNAAPNGRAWGRESFVGLSSRTWGTLTLGRQYTLAQQLTNKLQPFGNPNIDSLNVLAMHHIPRQDNMIKYQKQFGTASVLATYTASEGNGKSTGLAGTYSAPGLELAAYGSHMSAATGGEVRKIYGVGGSYQISQDWKGFAIYMHRSNAISTQTDKVGYVALNYAISPAVLLTATHVQDRQNAFATNKSGSRKVTQLQVAYALSKRTDVYLSFDQNQIDGGFVRPAFIGRESSQTGVSLGLRQRI